MTEMSPQLYSARADIPLDHPCFPGHFPGQPILPGVLLLERVMSLAQAWSTQPLGACTIYNVKFLSAVVPGDALDVRLAGSNPNEYRFTVHVLPAESSDGVLACSGQLRITPP